MSIGHDKAVIDCSILARRVERTNEWSSRMSQVSRRTGRVPSANSYYPAPLTPLIGAQLRARDTVLYVKPLLGGRDYLALARRLRRRLFSSTKTHEKAAQKHVSLPTPDHHSALPRCLLRVCLSSSAAAGATDATFRTVRQLLAGGRSIA